MVIAANAQLGRMDEAQNWLAKFRVLAPDITIARIKAETDPAKLREGLAQMEEAKSQVPPEMKPVLELIVKRAQERLAALEGQKK